MIKHISKKSFIGIFLIVAFLFVGVSAISTEKLNDYRIRIHSTSGDVTIRVDNNYEIFVDNVKNSYSISSSREDLIISKKDNGVVIKNSSGTEIGSGTEIQIKKKDSTMRYFEVKGIDGVSYAKYPGNVILRRNSSLSNILVINSTELETYLKGVLPHEMGAGAPLEALKAQAVAARTLAVKRVNKNSAEGFDITNTTSDQVYKGYNDSYFNSSSNVYKAVEETKGRILKYNGNLIEGLYYSNNGGQTASDGFVWSSGNSTPYYVSKADTYDTYLNDYVSGWAKLTYSETYTKKELRDVIIKNSTEYPGYFKPPYCTPAFNGLSEDFDIEVLESTNGYVTKIRLSDDTGREYILKNYANRWVFGLRSQQYTMNKTGGLYIKNSSSKITKETVYAKNSSGKVVSIKDKDIVVKSATKTVTGFPDTIYTFKGKGYGHGIGMSQNGAMNRATAGQKYNQILQFYYDGSTVGSNYGN